MLAKLLLAVLLGAAVFLAFVALQPPTGSVVRTAFVSMPPQDVFGYINDFHKWREWSPWTRADAQAKLFYEGAETGSGATYSWWGNSEAGEAKMTILESQPGEHVKIAQTFKRPFEDTGTSEFVLQPEGAGTFVIWRMTGERPFAQRVLWTVLGTDARLAEKLDNGLENLDGLARK